MSGEPVLAENLGSVIRYLVWLLNSGRDAIDRWWVNMMGPHHEIHEGNSYTYPFVDIDVDIAAPKYILIRTPVSSEQQHLTVSVGADGVAIAELYETATITDDGTARTPINRNRRSVNLSNVDMFEDPTVGADGTRLAYMSFGGAGVGMTRLTGAASLRDEFILMGDEDYVIKVTVAADNTVVNITPDWYEVTPD